MVNPRVNQIISAAADRLNTARFGLEDMKNPYRAQSGIYNAVVFGRMVTFALQNLRNVMPEFDEWYGPIAKELSDNRLFKFFSDLRTQIEKKAEKQVAAAVHVVKWSDDSMDRFEPAPPNATAHFIGGKLGGAGWLVPNSDGSEDEYYVDLPPDIGTVNLRFLRAPDEFAGIPARDLIGAYLDRLERLIGEARERFGGSPSP